MTPMTKFSMAGLLLAASSHLAAAELTLSVQNLTQGMYFTPVLLAAHSPDHSLFEVGQPASDEIQAMAEGGSLDGLTSLGDSIGADALANPAGGLLGPGATTSGQLSTSDGNTLLSVVAMILPSNDGFIGLDDWTIPTETGTYEIYLNAYDAGTEANDELRGSGTPGEAGMPVPPPLDPELGSGGSGVTSDIANTNVHIHPGNLGDDSLSSGHSDVDNSKHRWLNPIAKLTVTVE